MYSRYIYNSANNNLKLQLQLLTPAAIATFVLPQV